MLEFELARPKAKRTFALVVIAILLISDDGIAHIGQLNSYLVSSSRYEIDENEAYVLFGAKHFIIEFGVFCAFGECGNDLYGVGIGKLFEIASEFIGLVSRRAVNDCKISLLHFTVSYGLAKARCRFGRFGKHHYATSGSVKAVYKPEIRITGFVIRFNKVLFEHIDHIRVTAFVCLHGHVVRFDDDEHVIVFIYDFQVFVSHNHISVVFF